MIASVEGGAVLAVIALAALVTLSLYWSHRRSNHLLKAWAEENRIIILNAEERWFRRGPFFWSTGKGQTVYYVTVRDEAGRQRSGWVRCGSFWGGLFSSKVEVRWDRG